MGSQDMCELRLGESPLKGFGGEVGSEKPQDIKEAQENKMVLRNIAVGYVSPS